MTDAASGQRRYLALFFPFLASDRLRIVRPDRLARRAGQAAPPFVLAEKVKGAMRLSAVDPAALELGLVSGMMLADARAQTRELEVFDADPRADAAWLERLCDGALRYTPMAAVDAPDGLMLDITGCAHLMGGEGALAADAAARLERRGMHVRWASGGTPEAAHALARFPAPPAPDEASALRRLPIAALELPPESELGLRRAGLKRVGDLVDRPRSGLAARFGADAVAALDRLLGIAARPIAPRRPTPAIRVERRFAEPVARTSYALRVLGELLTQAAVRLDERHQGGRLFEGLFFRTDGIVFPLRVETGSPTRDPAPVLRLMRERIDSLSDPIDPGFGFDLVRLDILRAEPLAAAQLPLEAGRAQSGGAAANLIDTLSTRVGRERLLRFTPRDTHIPEQAELSLPAVDLPAPAPWADPDAPPAEAGDPPMRPLHLFDPPQPIEVIADVPEGPPRRFRWRRASHDVSRYEGPERIAPEWWRDGAESHRVRDYYRVEDVRGRRFWIFRHGLYGEAAGAPGWYLHGLFA